MTMLLSRTSVILLALAACIFADPDPPTGTLCAPMIGKLGCVCNHPDGQGVIDLTGLGKQDGTARFSGGITDPVGYSYAWNPCYSFDSTNGGCNAVFVCQTQADGSASYTVADAQEQIWIDDTTKVPYVYYTGPDNRNTRVYLDCDKSVTGEPQVTTTGDSVKQLSYVFRIKSDKVCPTAGGGGGSGGGDGESIAGIAGIVIIFLLLGALVTYFVIGAVIMTVKYNAAGSDIIPHKAFWLALPLLIKDGVLFTFSPCVSAFKNRGYDKA